MHPPFAYSLFLRHDGTGTFAYKVLNPRAASTATPLVLIHGLSAVGLVDWLPLAERLAESRPVLIFDNRNVGGSTVPKERLEDDYTLQDLANDVIELVKHVGWKEVDIMGFSMGGMIAQVLLVTPHLPFKVRHAVLAATSAKPGRSDLLAAIPSQPASDRRPTIEDKIDIVTPFIHVGYDPSFVADAKNSTLLNQRVLESVHTRRPARTIGRQLQAIATYDVRPHLHRIPASLPVLLLHGKLDRAVFFSERKHIERGIPHAQLALLPHDDFGHMWYDYFSVEFWTRLLVDFLGDKEKEREEEERKGLGLGRRAKL